MIIYEEKITYDEPLLLSDVVGLNKPTPVVVNVLANANVAVNANALANVNANANANANAYVNVNRPRRT